MTKAIWRLMLALLPCYVWIAAAPPRAGAG